MKLPFIGLFQKQKPQYHKNPESYHFSGTQYPVTIVIENPRISSTLINNEASFMEVT